MHMKTKDCVFSVILLLVGGFVVVEGLRMVELASNPPFRIQQFRISPGMLPTVLGGGLIVFALLLLASSLRGEGASPASSLVRHLSASSVRIRKALGDADVESMIVCVIIMANYTFFILGVVPFWLSSAIILLELMFYLRASKWWVILSVSAASIIALIILFEKVFGTTLP